MVIYNLYEFVLEARKQRKEYWTYANILDFYNEFNDMYIGCNKWILKNIFNKVGVYHCWQYQITPECTDVLTVNGKHITPDIWVEILDKMLVLKEVKYHPELSWARYRADIADQEQWAESEQDKQNLLKERRI